MRIGAAKSEEHRAAAAIFRTRDLLVRQQTQLIDVLRGRRGEFGLIAPQDAAQVGQLTWMHRSRRARDRRCVFWLLL